MSWFAMLSAVNQPAPKESRDGRTERIVVFLVTATGLGALALEGGAYDIVVRNQVGLVLWWVLALALLLRLMPRSRPSGAGLLTLAALAALAVWTALSLSWTSDAERSFTEVARLVTHLGVLVLVATGLTAQTWRAAVGGATAAGAGIVVYALAGRLAPDVFGPDAVAGAFDTTRLSRPLGYWNAVGAWAGMTSILCLAWSAHARRPITRGLALAVMPVAATTAYLTYSRASLIGIVIGLMVLLAASRNRFTIATHGAFAAVAGYLSVRAVRAAPAVAEGTGDAGADTVLVTVLVTALFLFILALLTARGLDRVRMPRGAARAVLATSVSVAAILAVLAAANWGPSAWDQFRDPTNTVSDDPAERLRTLNGSRYLLWSAALEAAREDPLKGTGAGTFEYTWNVRTTSSEFVRDAHSLYFETVSELGAPGIILLLCWVAGVIFTLAQALRLGLDSPAHGAVAGVAGATGAFLLGGGVDWLWESTALAVFALILIGSVTAATGRRADPVSTPTRIFGSAVALALCALQLPGLMSTSAVRDSQRAFEEGAYPQAAAYARDAVEAQPWAASPFVQRALIAEAAGDLSAARRDLLRAEERAPKDWRTQLLLARIEARRGDATAALRAYRRAQALRPTGKFFEPAAR